MRSLPNALSVARGLTVIPVVLLIVDREAAGWALAAFCTAAVTDAIDGALARRLGSTTALGVFLDPLADKVLVLGTLLALLAQDAVAAWVVGAILAREALAVGLRSLGAARGIAMEATGAGKAKTALQFVAVMGLLLAYTMPAPGVSSVASLVAAAAVAVTLLSAVELLRGVPPLFLRDRESLADAR